MALATPLWGSRARGGLATVSVPTAGVDGRGERVRGRGKVKVVKINTETYPAIASQYGINALPTCVLFKDGKPVDRIEGLLQTRQYIERINYFLQ
jgi:thiol-disulfide isomerase/thioredoxin